MPHSQIPPAELDRLTRAAAAVARNAYAPYSNFFVGAAILLESGHIVTGCNVENASYRLTSCAEQSAVASAVAQHGPKLRIQAVAVANLAPNNIQVACQPCGACRQTLAEFASPETLIAFPGTGGLLTTCTLADLLPAAFSPASLTP